MLTGWLGVGTALSAAMEQPDGLALLRRMAKGWPFFDDLLGKVEMVCAKTDLDIAHAYVSRLGGDLTLLTQLEQEFDRTVRCLLEIRETSHLIADSPVLQSAIALRNPYVDPLSLFQITFLHRKYTEEGSDTDQVRLDDAIATTMSGIAQGLRNTG
jgi:phosphoenolpyruvate carboxylase